MPKYTVYNETAKLNMLCMFLVFKNYSVCFHTIIMLKKMICCLALVTIKRKKNEKKTNDGHNDLKFGM